MKYHRYLIIIGIWVIIVPFLGVSLMWKKIFLIIPAIILFVMASAIMQSRSKKIEKDSGSAFKDSEYQTEKKSQEQVASEQKTSDKQSESIISDSKL